ncbi:MAG: secreted protein [Alphaproteobacteria bacterium]|nr:secreted protein [Alphaproteobacteria bacterium]
MQDFKIFKKLAVFAFTALTMASCAKDDVPLKTTLATVNTSPVSPPLTRAYAHNDYKHDAPLFDALRHGFTTVEADVFLVNGELLVGHTMGTTRPGRTLEALYLKPLAEMAEKNDGHIYPQSGQSLQLLIDVKSGGAETHYALEDLLQRYAGLLTSYQVEEVREGAVTVLLSGKRPPQAFLRQASLRMGPEIRYAAYDGRLQDLPHKYSPAVMPLISADWNRNFDWRGIGPMEEKERKKLRDIVGKAHENGQDIRFWATPERDPAARTAVWKELVRMDVDYINTDHLPELHAWLLQNDPQILAQNNGRSKDYVRAPGVGH